MSPLVRLKVHIKKTRKNWKKKKKKGNQTYQKTKGKKKDSKKRCLHGKRVYFLHTCWKYHENVTTNTFFRLAFSYVVTKSYIINDRCDALICVRCVGE